MCIRDRSDTYQALPGQPTSLWLATTPTTDLPALQAGLTVDVAIVGGGIAGLTAATLLKSQGKRCLLYTSRWV